MPRNEELKEAWKGKKKKKKKQETVEEMEAC